MAIYSIDFDGVNDSVIVLSGLPAATNRLYMLTNNSRAAATFYMHGSNSADVSFIGYTPETYFTLQAGDTFYFGCENTHATSDHTLDVPAGVFSTTHRTAAQDGQRLVCSVVPSTALAGGFIAPNADLVAELNASHF